MPKFFVAIQDIFKACSSRFVYDDAGEIGIWKTYLLAITLSSDCCPCILQFSSVQMH